MTHQDYIKKRDSIIDRYAGYIGHDEWHFDCDRSDGHVDFDDEEAARAIDALVLQLVGNDEKNWIGPWGDTHNVPTDGMVSRNELRTEQRKTVQGGNHGK